MIVKGGLDNAKTKLIYYVGENNENSKKINLSLNKLLNYYTSTNTKRLTSLTDEVMIENKKVLGNNSKYINIINRTVENSMDDSEKRARKFEKIGE